MAADLSPPSVRVARGTVPWATLALAALALSTLGWPDAARLLVYERDRVLTGEWWRLWTANFVHFGGSHLGWNLLVFVPTGIWAERMAPGRTRLMLALTPGLIGIALLAFDPALTSYAGLSGVAAGTLALLAFLHLRIRNADRLFWGGVLALLAVKIGAEAFLGRALFAHFTATDIRPVPLAHLAGVAGAAVVCFTWRPRPI